MSGSHNRHNKIESEKKSCRKQFRIIDESLFRRRILFCAITILDREPLSLEIVRDNSAKIPGTIQHLHTHLSTRVQATRFRKPIRP
jgi:hypothetical protein